MDLRRALTVLPDAAAVAEQAAAQIAAAAAEAVRARGRFAVALTGGSSPLELYALLAREPHRSAPYWAHTHVFWGDERAAAPDDPRSNFGAAHRALLAHVPVPAGQVHRMEAERADLDAAAADYAEVLGRVLGGDPPALDVLLLGVGGDAHILSLYPGCPDIAAPRAHVVALHDPPMNPRVDRLTLTPPLLEAAREVIVIVPGAAKADALAQMVEGPADEARVPAQLVARARGRVSILCDEAAAAKLRPRP